MASFDDKRQDAVEIIPHLCRPDSQRPNSTAGEPRVSSLVTLWACTELVGEAIHFDGKRGFVTEKVQIIWAMLVLFAKFEAVRPLLEHVP